MSLKRQFKSFPWGSLGRPESLGELLHKWRQQRAAVGFLPQRPLVSLIIVDDGSASESALSDSLGALSFQSYPHWEAVVVTSGRAVIDGEWRNSVRWITADNGMSEAEKRNFGASHTQGDWVGFIRAGDVLSPVTLFLAIAETVRHPQTQLIYTHEAAIDDEGKKVVSFYSKPAHSWFNLIHFNYIGNFWLVKGDLLSRLSGFRSAAGVHCGHDFLLRASESDSKFHLLPFFLYYPRGGGRITAGDEVLARVVEEHLARLEITASVRLEDGRIKVHPRGSLEVGLVSAIICFKDKAEWTIKSIDHLCRRAGNVPLEIFLVNNGSTSEERFKVEEYLSRVRVPIKIVDYGAPFNFAEMHNVIAREHARGRYLLALNNDVFLEKGDLSEWVAWAELPWVGTVGICLRHAHGDVQHGGLRAFFGGTARLARIGHEVGEDDLTRQNREVFGNTFAATLFKKETFDEIGGLRALDLPNGFGDVAFNFDCLRLGLKNIFLGHFEGVHLESASRGTTYEYWEEVIVEREYADLLQRMLREDLGYSRVPGIDLSVPEFTRAWVLVKVREKLPWLKPVKVAAKKMLRELGLRGDNALTKYENAHSRAEKQH